MWALLQINPTGWNGDEIDRKEMKPADIWDALTESDAIKPTSISHTSGSTRLYLGKRRWANPIAH